MKLFQQLLVAPAALGLMAPVAATAAELNINDVSSYSSSKSSLNKAAKKRTKSFSQFSDVYPTDWAFQALSSMLERHGCAPLSTRGSMTRHEVAAVLNNCLAGVAQINETERRLVNEFKAELAVVKGLEGVEAGVAYEGNGGPGFSTTTQMGGAYTFLLAGVERGATSSQANNEAVTFSYTALFSLENSFNGDDLLYAEIEAGNTPSDPFETDVALEMYSNGSTLTLTKLLYQFPLNDEITIVAGPKVEQGDLLGAWPSDYPTETVLDVLTYAGGGEGAYANAEGAGASLIYEKGNLIGTVAVVSEEATDTKTGANSSGGGGGVLTEAGSDDVTLQLAWAGDNYLIAGAYTHSDGGLKDSAAASMDRFTAWSLGGVYNPDIDHRVVPASISFGIGLITPGTDDDDGADDSQNTSDDVEDKNTWTLGMVWEDVGIEGNTLGIGVGTAEAHHDDSDYDEPLAWEMYYSMAISDNLTVTPAVFTVEKDGASDYSGALVKTTFSF